MADHPNYKEGIAAVKSLEKELWEALKREPNFGFIEGTFQARFAKAIENLVNTIKNSLITRVKSTSGFTLIHSETEIAQIINKGKTLNLANNEIEDLLYISCREAKPINASELMTQMENWVNVVSKRGFPYKFNDIGQFNNFKNELKAGLNDIGVSTADVRIQGSAIRTPNAGDVDIAVVVEDNLFNQLLKNNFSGKITKNGSSIDISNYSQAELTQLSNEIAGNSAYNAQARTFEYAFKSGKIRPEDIEGLKTLKNKLEPICGKIDISAIRKNGNFDIKPFLKLN